MSDEKKIVSPGGEIKTLEHNHSPVHGAHSGGEAAEPTAAGFSFRRLIDTSDNTKFFEEALDKVSIYNIHHVGLDLTAVSRSQYGYDGAISPEAEKRLKRKLDCLILPMYVLKLFFTCSFFPRVCAVVVVARNGGSQPLRRTFSRLGAAVATPDAPKLTYMSS